MRRAPARWVVWGGWALVATTAIWLLLFSRIDRASAILFVLGLGAGAVAIWCLGSAIEARDGRDRILWIGRAAAFGGAAFSVSFPGQLYQEIQMLLSRSQTPDAWYPGAIWYSAATMPLVIVPALVALPWSRLGGALFLADALFIVVERLYRPFGVIFPDASTDPGTFVAFVLAPPLVTGLLLLAGSAGRQRARSSISQA
jgi:hypothetical protein